MSTALLQPEHELGVTPAVNLLYICEFPPCNYHGGAVLMHRLLKDYPPDRLIVFTTKPGLQASGVPDRLSCRHVAFPSVGGSQRLWLSRAKQLINWAVLVWVSLVAMLTIKRYRIGVILAVLQGWFCFAAAVVGRLTGTPYVMVVHDDFICRRTWFSRHILKPLTGMVLRRATHIYAVSPAMQRLILREFGAHSEVQWPATGAYRTSEGSRPHTNNDDVPVILFAGGLTHAVGDGLDLLATLISSGKLREYGIPKIRFHLHTNVTEEERRVRGWDHPDILSLEWVAQTDVPKVLYGADILFLPYSFREGSRHLVETAFPSKTADYLAAGKPILVVGPPYSTLVQYASEEGFAEVVTEPNVDMLAHAIQRIVLFPEHARMLAARAHDVFYRNHDIERQRRDFRALLQMAVSGNGNRRVGARLRPC
jgi:glycosyltransferase involved in cell wall biosynthesis